MAGRGYKLLKCNTQRSQLEPRHFSCKDEARLQKQIITNKLTSGGYGASEKRSSIEWTRPHFRGPYALIERMGVKVKIRIDGGKKKLSI